MERVRSHRGATGSDVRLWVAPPRVFKMGEDWILRIVRSAEPDGYLCRNAEHLRAFQGGRLRGDFSLNVANPLSADYFMQRWGLEGLTASYDLNISQLTSLLEAAPPEWFEVTLHQRMPLFHMEHCVFCAFLSQGHDYRDCCRPCEKHRVRLRDRTGAELYVRADAGCRNTVFNSRTQTGADFAQHLLGLGVRRFRIEFLEENPDEIRQTLDRYRRLLKGELSGEQLWRELKLSNQLGITRGTLKKG
jgi:putative protease